MNGAIDARERWIISGRSGDASKDVGGGGENPTDWCVQEIRNVVGRDTELAEAVEQIGSTARAGSTCDVVLGLSSDSDRTADLGVQTGGCDGSDLGVPGCSQGRQQ